MSDETTEQDSTDDDSKGQGIPDSDEAVISDEEVKQIEKEREERLDPENRPANAEVDNTQRGFDTETESFQKAGEDVENGPVIGADRPDGVEVDDD